MLSIIFTPPNHGEYNMYPPTPHHGEYNMYPSHMVSIHKKHTFIQSQLRSVECAC